MITDNCNIKCNTINVFAMFACKVGIHNATLGSLPSIKWMDMDHDYYCVP